MTAVLPEEVPDERLRPVPVGRIAHEGVLKFARDPPDIEHPVPALHAFQVDRRDVHVVAEQEVRRSRIAMPRITSSAKSPLIRAAWRSLPSCTKPARAAARIIAVLLARVSACNRCRPRTAKPYSTSAISPHHYLPRASGQRRAVEDQVGRPVGRDGHAVRQQFPRVLEDHDAVAKQSLGLGGVGFPRNWAA